MLLNLNHRLRGLVVFVTVSLLSIGCGTTPGPDATPLQSPIGSPLATSPTLVPIPTPASGKAIVHGRFEALTDAGKLLLAGAVYVAQVEYSQGETVVPLLKLDFSNDPKSTMNTTTGQFIITDISPGQYGIIVHTPINDFIIHDEATNETRFLTLVAGQVEDLGTLYLP